MSNSKAKKSLLNVFTGIFSQAVTIALGIIIPRLVLVNLGSEANGLLNSVNQVLVYAGLLEAGVGMATTQALYGPLANNDRVSINGIMSATNLFYKKTGFLYLVAVLGIAIVYPLVVKSELSKFVIIAVIVLSGLPSAVNYYFQGKYKLLLNADGKSYVITNVSMCINVCTSICKILLLTQGFDVVALQAMYLFFNIVQMIVYSCYIKKNYKWLNVKAKPDYNSISQKNSVLFHQVSGLVFSNTDMILLSVFTNLKVVSVYSMYVMLFGMVGTLIQNMNSGVMFALGQAYNSDKKKFIVLHDSFELYNMTLTFSLFCIANIFIEPFLKLYTAGVNDISYIDKLLPYLFISTYLLENGRTSSMKVINYAGHFKQTKHHAMIEMCINLVVSIVGVKFYGIYGVLIGTSAALLFRTNAMIIYASKKLLKRTSWIVYRRWILNLVVFAIFTFVCKNISIPTNNYFQIVLSAAISCVIIIPLFFVIASLSEIKTFKNTIAMLKPYLLNLKRKVKR